MATVPQEIRTTRIVPWPMERPAVHPAIEFLRRIHRGEGSAVSLCRKNPAFITEKNKSGWENLGTVAASHFPVVFDGIQEALSVDAYWTISSTYLRDGYAGHGRSKATGLVLTKRRVRDLSYINSAYVDIDSVKAGLAPAESYSMALGHLREMDLPLPSISLFSGRGVWLFWPFVEPVRAFMDSTCEYLSRINDNLVKRLAFCGADGQSKDAARVCRIPGSINSKSGSQVYWQDVPGGAPVILEQFAGMLGVPARKTSVSLADRKPLAQRHPDRVRRGYQRWITRRVDILQIIESRGHLPEGTRTNTFFYLAAVSRNAGIKPKEIESELLEINRRCCNPALPDSKVTDAIKGGLSTRHSISDTAIIERLRISPEECASLNLYVGRPKAPRTVNKKAQIADRRKLINVLGGSLVSVRDMVELLKGRGISVSREIVRKDYLAIEGK